MIKSLLKPAIGLGAFTSALSLPLALVIACGEAQSTPTPTTPDEIAEAKAIADISAAPTAPGTNDEAILSTLKVTAQSKLSANQNLTAFLYATKPSATSFSLADHQVTLVSEMRRAGQSRYPEELTVASLSQLLFDLGVAEGALTTKLQDFMGNYDSQGTNALASGSNYLAMWRYLFNSAANYANLQAAFIKLGINTSTFIKLDRVFGYMQNTQTLLLTPSKQDIVSIGGGFTILRDLAELERATILQIASPAKDELIVQALNMVLARLAAASMPPVSVATYLSTHAPNTLTFDDYALLLIDGINAKGKLPRANWLDAARFTALLTALGVDVNAFKNSFNEGFFGGTNASAGNRTSWYQFLRSGDVLFVLIGPAQALEVGFINSFTNPPTLTTPALTTAQLNNFDRVLSAPINTPSGVLDMNGAPINGLGGVSPFAKSR